MTARQRRTVRWIFVPVCAWAVHFVFVYAALSAACAARGLLDFGMVVITVLLATALAVAVAGWHIFRLDESATDLGVAARWSAIISVAAILFDATPILFVESCR